MGKKEFDAELKKRYGISNGCQKCGGETIACPHCKEFFCPKCEEA